MALKNCTECGEKVSDKALFCPHCGYILDGSKIKKVKNNIFVRIEGGRIEIEDLLMAILFIGIILLIALAIILK